MKSQKELLAKNDWDILLLFDATRYDIFSEVYKGVLGDIGELQKVESVATASQPWFFENFEIGKPREDIVYISPDFELSSLDTKFMNFKYKLRYGGKPYNITHFIKYVVDVWKDGYDEKYRVVTPETVVKETIKYAKKYPNKKIIGNYVQVHDPYISLMKEGKISCLNMQEFGARGRPVYDKYFLCNIKDIIRIFVNDERLWTIRKKLNLNTKGGFVETWLAVGKEGIIKAYKEDLILTLESTKKVIKAFPDKKIVITSDHGERLGERGCYGHGGRKIPCLIEVPWLEISGRDKK